MVLRLIKRKLDDGEETAMPKAVSGWPARAVDDLAPLVRRCRAGERDAVRTLIVTVGPLMLQMVRRVMGARDPDVEDVFQDATLGLVRALSGFRGECSTRHFACRIARLTALKARRRRRREGGAPDGDRSDPGTSQAADDAGPPGSGEEPSGWGWGAPDAGAGRPVELDWALASRRREALLRLLDDLPPPQAEALVLHCVGGLTVDEVASSTGVAVETTRSRLRLAKAALRERIALDPVAADLLLEGGP